MNTVAQTKVTHDERCTMRSAAEAAFAEIDARERYAVRSAAEVAAVAMDAHKRGMEAALEARAATADANHREVMAALEAQAAAVAANKREVAAAREAQAAAMHAFKREVLDAVVGQRTLIARMDDHLTAVMVVCGFVLALLIVVMVTVSRESHLAKRHFDDALTTIGGAVASAIEAYVRADA
ncbi:MAG TPA: hypothetical protein VKD22_16210 [Ramlibacter sp.]|nr:hypothetical protein [Ramlibacter sp.]